MKTNCKFKKLSVLLVLAMLLSLLTLAGCGKENANDPKNHDEPGSSETSGNKATDAPGDVVKSDGYEKFSKLEIGMTEADVNAILGEPTKVDKAYYYYNITVNGQDMEITVWINMTTGLVTYMNGDFYKDAYLAEFADSATDLSTVDGLDNGNINTYEDCAKAFKTPGYPITIDEDGTTRYLWVDSTNGYMIVTFKADGTVKTYSGFC